MVEKSIERLRAFLRRPGMNKTLLATTAGISRRSLDGIDKPDWNPNRKTLDKLDAAMTSLKRAIDGK